MNGKKTILRCHFDADGITTAYLTSFHLDNPEIQIWDGEFGDIKGLVDGDYLCDMHPTGDFKGTVIDHHDVENYPMKRNYTLITGHKPAGVLAWEHFKEEIPKNQWWKVAISAMGDGQPEMIPFEVFDSCPQLFNKIKTSAFWDDKKFEYKLNHWIAYKLVSSPINALLRVKSFDKALKLISEAELPEDIIYDEEAGKAKDEVKKDFRNIMKYCKSYQFNNLNVIIFNSNYRMSGYVSTVVLEKNSEKTTTIAINSKDGHGSLRGELSLYWQGKLKPLDYITCAGHEGFMGFQIKKPASVFIEDLTNLLK